MRGQTMSAYRKQRAIFLWIAGMVIFGHLASCTPADDDNGVSPLACEVPAQGQCFVAYRDGMYKYDLEEIKTWCECDDVLPSDACSTYGGEFHTGECTGDIIGRCDYEADRTRFFYDNFADTLVRSHSYVLSLQTACEASGGVFSLVKTVLCTNAADCDDGNPGNGAEICVTKEVCTGSVCTHAACESANQGRP